VTVLVDVEGGTDLVPVTIWDAHRMSIFEFAQKCNEKVNRARSRKDADHEKATAMGHNMPSFILQPFTLIATYIAVNMGYDLKAFGARSDAFGQAMITNIGPLGLK